LKKFKNKTVNEMSVSDRMVSLERKFKNLQEYVFERFVERPDMGDGDIQKI